MPLQYNTKSEMVNEAQNSYFYIGTAGSRSFGRSATLTNVHFSEIAYYPEPEMIYLSASQAGTPRRIIIESTANGVGDFFYTMWNKSVEGISNYKSHFYGWNKYTEYQSPEGVPIDLTEDERKYGMLHKLSDRQMMWRKKKRMEFTNDYAFKQEYPITPEEAFVSSGNPVFDVEALSWYRAKEVMIRPPKKIANLVGIRPVTLEEKENGYLKIWGMPEEGGQYVIGADPAEGTVSGDFCCAQVINRKTFEQVAVWHGKADPDVFARELNKLGYFYNQAIIAPERNSMGIAVVLVLRELDYPMLYIRERIGDLKERLMPELGWVTDMRTKPLMISETARSIREKSFVLHDEGTLNELLSYQWDSAGHANTVKGAFDDRTTALMIAIALYNRTPLAESNINAVQQPFSKQFDPTTQDDYGNFSNPFDAFGAG